MKSRSNISYIFLDLDEVLADFVGSALKIHGISREELETHREPGRWDITKPLGLSDDEFWEPIHAAGSGFWSGLDPLPWADELVGLVEETGVPWHVVTSPSRCPTCYDGKVRWLKDFFGADFDRFIISPHKEIYAGPGRVILDDRD